MIKNKVAEVRTKLGGVNMLFPDTQTRDGKVGRLTDIIGRF